MTEPSTTTAWSESGLLIKVDNAQSEFDSSKPWRFAKLDSHRILAFSENAESRPESAYGFARCSADMLYDLIIGMNHRRWSGMIFIDTGFGQKKLFFNAGEFVFASSDLMDDRLGEVIYRDAIISLNQLTEFTVQVDRKTKFGQALLRSGIFSNTDLWNALKAQAREIFRSVFLVDHCYIEVQNGVPPIEVTFENGTEALLDSAYSFGTQFRVFNKRINSGVRVSPIESHSGIQATAGTFIGDFIELCNDFPTINQVIARSKLSGINTLVTIHRLIALGLLKLEGLFDPVAAKMDGNFGNLKSRIDAYQLLQKLAIQAFKSAEISFPIYELTAFALDLNHDGGATLYLDKDGSLPDDSIVNMLQQCATNTHRMSYFQIRIESLMRYLMQIVGDQLPYDVAKKLKNEFKEISS